MSIVRIGLAETKKFAQGYEAIFGKPAKGAKPAKQAESEEKTADKTAKKKTKRK